MKLPRRGSRVVQAARRRRRNPRDANFCLTVRRACRDVVRFNLETWLERSRGDEQWKNWPQRAKAVKSKDSHHTCRRGQDPVGRAVKEPCESCPFYLKKHWVSLGRRVCQLSSGPREENRGVGDSTRTTSSSKRSSGWLRLWCVLDSRCRGSCVHSINAEVPHDKCSLSGYTVRDLFLVLRCCTGTDAMRQRSCLCVTLQFCDLERSKSDEKAWTTEPSTMRIQERTRPPRAGTWSSDAWSGSNGGSPHSMRERMSDCRPSQPANA